MVLPVPVPPLTRNDCFSATNSRNRCATSAENIPASCSTCRSRWAGDNARRLMHGPSPDGGSSTAWTRTPTAETPAGRSVMMPSANGWASSSRTPQDAAGRTAMSRHASASSTRTFVGSTPRPRSTQTAPGPLSSTSVTSGSHSGTASSPSPENSRLRFRTSSTPPRSRCSITEVMSWSVGSTTRRSTSSLRTRSMTDTEPVPSCWLFPCALARHHLVIAPSPPTVRAPPRLPYLLPARWSGSPRGRCPP